MIKTMLPHMNAYLEFLLVLVLAEIEFGWDRAIFSSAQGSNCSLLGFLKGTRFPEK